MQYVDFHSHILPYMDDGSKSLEMSSIMLELLKEENVCIVFATPHYYCYRESEASFLARREECVQKLCDYLYENEAYYNSGNSAGRGNTPYKRHARNFRDRTIPVGRNIDGTL